jgi:hypothetical protein
MDYLRRFGIIVKCNGFDSERMYFQIRKNQNAKGWVDYLLNVDADGIPRLDYARKNWDESTATRKAKKRQESGSWLDGILKEIWR